MASLKKFREWIDQHRADLRDDYFAFLRFRSISSEPEFKSEVERCADWVKEYLQASGFKTELIATQRYPIVYAEDLHAPGKPTVLIYGHYDVQPVDPLELWKNDPFEPTERSGKVFARGAVDDKGQIFYAMAAMRALKENGGALPINVKFCIEGEEEDGSVGLSGALSKIQQKLKADFLLVVDHGAYDEKTPAINLGARGMLTMDVKLTGSKSDLHSGEYGGIAYNPNRALVELLAKLYDSNGRVAVDGFYDDVIEPSSEDKKAFAHAGDAASYAREYGIEALGGEKGRTIQEANLFRPVLEINGIGGGYHGPGFKTVIPAMAIAKLSCRLVPGQDPKKISRQITDFLHRHCVKGMKLDVHVHAGAPAYRANPASELANAVAAAAEEVTGQPCKRVLTGASIPIVASLSQTIGAEIVGMGYGLPTDLIHAPNENFDFSRLEKGLLTVARAMELLTQGAKR
ncbi:MAG: dipeptidase [Verrucomicrobiota bacterium]|nr:dipeptidase [Verrucomicrobiota bacterium]